MHSPLKMSKWIIKVMDILKIFYQPET